MILGIITSNKHYTFLIDTQADISVIKAHCINNLNELNEYEKIDIKGVTDGIITSLGTIDTDLTYDKNQIPQVLHVVPKILILVLTEFWARTF